MIRRAMARVLGGGCDELRAEVEVLRGELRILRARLAELERAAPEGEPVQAASFAEAAKLMGQGQRAELGDVAAAAPAAPPEAPAERPAGGRRPVVELEDCIACGTCVEYSPGAFELGGDGRAIVRSQGAPEEEVQEAMDACPTQCIRWEG
jgi:ferredoxin